MKTCSRDLCESTDIETGRTICRNCKKEQMRKKAEERREKDRVGYNARAREFRRTHIPTEVEIKKETERKAIQYLRDKKKIDERNAAWRRDNTPRFAAYRAKHIAKQWNRTPPWITKDQMDAIHRIYVMCSEITKETGVPHEVDHIIPLRGENVCGLNVPWNLQVLKRNGPNGNRSKQNKIMQ